jgi:hypothetical protein
MESPFDARSHGPDGRWWMRRQSEGYLYWHSYKTPEAREKWARIYYSRDDKIWLKADGTDSDLFFLREVDQWQPA